MSSDVTAGLTPDVYGQVHPEETEEMITQKMITFDEEVEKLPAASKKSILQAQEKCPDLLTKDFKLMFLRSEVFNADVSLSIRTKDISSEFFCCQFVVMDVGYGPFVV